jgi:hypothetical protein
MLSLGIRGPLVPRPPYTRFDARAQIRPPETNNYPVISILRRYYYQSLSRSAWLTTADWTSTPALALGDVLSDVHRIMASRDQSMPGVHRVSISHGYVAWHPAASSAALCAEGDREISRATHPGCYPMGWLVFELVFGF